MNLKNRVAVVTGGSSGIGQAICIALANEGCNVVFTYNSGEIGANKTVEMCNGKAEGQKVNLDLDDDVKKLFDYVLTRYKSLDVLVNCAGIEVKSDNQLDINTWKRTFETDLFWAVRCIDYSLPMIKSGKILNISSEYGDEWMGYKDSIAYSSAKAALNNFTKTLAKKLAPNINVNAVSPGYVDTPMWGNISSEDKKVFGKDQLIERFIKPEEVADMAIAIIKNDAMTGEVVVIDGGLSLKTV